MVIRYASALVTSLYSSSTGGPWLQLANQGWFRCIATSMLTVAADARRAGIPAIVGYDASSGSRDVFEIYTL